VGTTSPAQDNRIIGTDEPILVTGATGFIGSRLVKTLRDHGFRNVRCFARPTSDWTQLDEACGPGARLDVIKGNLLSLADCLAATRDVAVIFHLAAGRGEKSFPDAFMNSVVTTRNLLDAAREHGCLRRFVSISSFAVYSNTQKPRRGVLDESCQVERHPELRGDPYCFAKVKQDAIVQEYGQQFRIPYVIVRPGYVYGPGKHAITGRVGLDTLGVFLHLGGSNAIPFTFVDNCADAIMLAGVTRGIDGRVFNVVDDDLPSSRRFLRLYKQNVRRFTSLYLPHAVSYACCWLWEAYSRWSEEQLPPVFNRRGWHAYWKKTRYSNDKIKTELGWQPHVATPEGLSRYFQSCRERRQYA
jgi:nucleoside-diphosphate-sugar epimerase